jgi:hypothetical protein|tara:strand:- start:827 stop:1093 length:267 start_codon:yes stop_codon:yes gene_type:complete
MEKKPYNYNYFAVYEKNERTVHRKTCNYWEVPAHPSMMELLDHLIAGAAEIADKALKEYNSRQRQGKRMKATIKRKLKEKKKKEKEKD